VLVVLAAKFVEGAWVVALLVPSLLVLMSAVRSHYEWVARETRSKEDFLSGLLHPLLVVVPVETWNSVSQKALRFALTLSHQVQIVQSSESGP
jgi:hypothetical protein